MTSSSKTTANRRNAARSTGPRSTAGKRRSSRNALRHGLAASAFPDSLAEKDIDALALALAGELASEAGILARARLAAAAELEVRRVRSVRARLLQALLTAEEGGVEAERLAKGLAQAARLDRYQRRAMSRRNTLLRALMIDVQRPWDDFHDPRC